MLSIYKGIRVFYWAVSIGCIVGTAVATYFYPTHMIEIISIMTIIICLTLIILMKVTRNRFKNEVMSLLYDCHAQNFLDKVESLLGNRRSKSMKSTYAWLMALGYEVIGDYEAMRSNCMNITVKTHMSEYHRRMCSYYVEADEIELAKKEIEALKKIALTAKAPDKVQIERYIGECVRAIKIKTHDLDGLTQHFEREDSLKAVEPVLLTKVSVAETYGQVLIFTGEYETARKQLLFASRYGGDTKYKKYADTLLKSIDPAN